MTTFFRKKQKCAICGYEAEYTLLGSTNRFGSSDLDTRPPEMMRSTMDTWVYRCPHCDYCNSDITEKIAGAQQVINDPFYKKLFSRDDISGNGKKDDDDIILQLLSHYQNLASKFLAKSILHENAMQFTAAGWSALHAAWVYDDEKNAHKARECRLRAAELFLKGIDKGEVLMKEGTELLLSDVFRRAGNFERANEFADKGLDAGPNEVLSKLLKFEQALILKKDIRCYSMEHALKS